LLGPCPRGPHPGDGVEGRTDTLPHLIYEDENVCFHCIYDRTKMMKMAILITARRWCICCRSVSVRLSRSFLAAKQQKLSLGNQRRLVSLACFNNGWLLTTKHADCCYACLVSLSAINTVICCRCPSRRRRNYITATIAVESGSRQATGVHRLHQHSAGYTRDTRREATNNVR